MLTICCQSKLQEDNTNFVPPAVQATKANSKFIRTMKNSVKIKSCVTSHTLVNLYLASVVHSAKFKIPVTLRRTGTHEKNVSVLVRIIL